MQFTRGDFAISRVEELTMPSVTPEEFFVGLPAGAHEHFARILGPEGLIWPVGG